MALSYLTFNRSRHAWCTIRGNRERLDVAVLFSYDGLEKNNEGIIVTQSFYLLLGLPFRFTNSYGIALKTVKIESSFDTASCQEASAPFLGWRARVIIYGRFLGGLR